VCLQKKIDIRNRIIVGCYTSEEWSFIVDFLKNESVPKKEYVKFYNIPDHFGLKIQSTRKSIEWDIEHGYPTMPSGNLWFYTKWGTKQNNIFRGLVKSFKLTWSSWNHAVYLSFSYECEVYDWIGKSWMKQ